MCERQLTPYSDDPSIEYLEELASRDATVLAGSRHDSAAVKDDVMTRKGKIKRRRMRVKSDGQEAVGDLLRLSMCSDGDGSVGEPASPDVVRFNTSKHLRLRKL